MLKYTPVINFPVLDDVCIEAGRRGQVLPPLLQLAAALLLQGSHAPSALHLLQGGELEAQGQHLLLLRLQDAIQPKAGTN